MKKKTWITLFIVFALTFAYAFARYITYGPVSNTNIPTIIVNKAVAFSIVVWLVFLIRDYFKQTIESFKLKLDILQSLIFIHIFLSIVLLTQQQLPKFFSYGQLTIWGNLTVLTGTITLTFFFLVIEKSWQNIDPAFHNYVKSTFIFYGF